MILILPFLECLSLVAVLRRQEQLIQECLNAPCVELIRISHHQIH